MKHTVVVLLAIATLAAPAASWSAADCPITPSIGEKLANDELSTIPPGTFVFQPNGPGFMERDGALGIKFAFERLKSGRLSVGGRRLDAAAGPARAYIHDYGDSGFQPIYLVFPTPGCWEINGGVGAAKSPLTFVVLVEKVGDGPLWRQDDLASGRRITTHWREE